MLSDKDKIFINKKIEDGLNDYVVIAKLLFEKEKLTGRSKQAKLVRDYLVETGIIDKKKKQFFIIRLLGNNSYFRFVFCTKA